MQVFSAAQQYHLLIDPLLRKAHNEASSLIKEDSKVMDIACGNGTLALKHASRSSMVTAIDLSAEMISFARNRAVKHRIPNIVFIAMDANDLSRFDDHEFDYATISMAMHQFRPEEGKEILREIGRIAREIILIDYAFPLPGGFKGLFTRIIERMAGQEHNRNFKDYLKSGGITVLCKACGFDNISYEAYNSVFVVLKCHKSGN